MKKPTEEDDFNWVEARQNCSAAKAFEALKKIVEANVTERETHLGKNGQVQLTFEVNSSSQFSVTMQSSSSYKSVVFHLRKDQDRIFLTLNGDKKSDLTPFMNDAWECRFKVNNEGEFLPWQVAQKALEEILF